MTTPLGSNWLWYFIYGEPVPPAFSAIRGAWEMYEWYYAHARLHALYQGGP